MDHIIIGNGPAGTHAGLEIRRIDDSASITILSDENYPFYSRPRLPELISGKSTAEDTIIFPLKWYEEKKINLELNTRVISVDIKKKGVECENGKIFRYDKLLFASGSIPGLIPAEGINGKNIFTLRTIDDAIMLKSLAEKCEEVTVIGGGLLGLEAANSLISLGLKVTVVEFFPRLIPRQIDDEGSEVLKSQLEKMGFKFILGAVTEKIDDEGNRKILYTKNGNRISSDFILVSAGIKPLIEVAENAGILCKKGIQVNDRMETNINNIFAAGDIAEHKGRVYGTWIASKEQGELAGKSMSGDTVAYNGTVPAMTLKVAGINFASIGEFPPAEEHNYRILKRLEPDNGLYHKIFIKEGKIRGAILLGKINHIQKIKGAIGKDFRPIKNLLGLTDQI